MDDGDRCQAPGELARTWRVLLDAQVRLEEQRTTLRTSVAGVFLAVILGTVVIRRFVFITAPERWLLVASPVAVMLAAAFLDHWVLGGRVRRLADLGRTLETGSDRELDQVRRAAVAEPDAGRAVALFYGLPSVVTLGLAAWGLL